MNCNQTGEGIQEKGADHCMQKEIMGEKTGHGDRAGTPQQSESTESISWQ